MPNGCGNYIQIKRELRGRLLMRNVPRTGFLNPPEAVTILNVGLRQVYRLLDQGKLVPSLNSSPLKNVSVFDTARLDEFVDHTGTEYLIWKIL